MANNISDKTKVVGKVPLDSIAYTPVTKPGGSYNDAFSEILQLPFVITVDTQDEMAAIRPVDGIGCRITTTARAGLFRWTDGDFTAEHAADPDEYDYVKGDGIDVNSGIWVRLKITALQLGDNAVTTTKISADAVTGPKIASGAVSTAKIAGGAVTTEKLAEKSVTRAKASSDIVTQVANVTELRAVVKDALSDGSTVKVIGTPRKGGWDWDSSDLSAEVAADPYNPVTGVGGIEFMPLDGEDGSTGAFRRIVKENRYYAGWAGAVPYDSDSPVATQAALNYFFDYFEDIEQVTLVWSGEWAISENVHMKGNDDQDFVHGRLICIGGMAEALTIDAREARGRGAVRVTGTGGNDYNSRTVLNLIGMAQPLRSNFADGFVVENALRYGIVSESEGYVGTSNTIDVGYGRIRAINCGSAGDRDEDNVWSVKFTYSARTDTGTANNSNQRTELTVSGMPAELRVEDQVRIGTGFYDVTAVDHGAGTLELFPWVDPIGSTSGDIYSCHGGAVLIDGANTADCTIDAINALRCGCGLMSSALYGPVVKNLQTQVTAISIGQRGLNYGFTVIGFHPETPPDTAVDFLKLDTVTSRTNIMGFSVLRWGDIRQLSPRDLTGSQNDGALRQLAGVNFLDGSGTQFYTGVSPRNSNATANLALSNKQGDNVKSSNRNAALTVTLSFDDDADRLFGAKTASLLRCGVGATGGASGDITIEPSSTDATAGITVMGSSSYVVAANSDYAVRVDFLFDYREQDWRVIQIPGTEAAAAISDPSGGATVDAEARAAINDIIDALQKNGVVT